MKNFFYTLWQNKLFRVYVWQLIVSLLMVAWVYASTLDESTRQVILIVWIPLLNMILKEFNTKYLWDLWVETDPVIEDLENLLKEAKKSLADNREKDGLQYNVTSSLEITTKVI